MLDVTRVDNCISTLLNLPLKHFARLTFFLFNQHKSIIHMSVYNIYVCTYRHTYVDGYSSKIHYSSLIVVLNLKSYQSV